MTLRSAVRHAAFVVAALCVQPAASQTTELRILASNGVKAVMEALEPEYERATGRRVAVRFNTSTALKAAIDGGEAFDVAIVTSELMDTLIKDADIVPGSRSELARTGIGVGVRAGAKKPDIATPEGMKRALLDSRALTYARDGASRMHIESMLNRLGIMEAMKPKTILEQGSIRSTGRVAQGDADMVITLVSEILPIQGIELVGPLPDAFQSYVSFSAGIGTKARDPDGARTLLEFLGAPDVRSAFKARGLDPADPVPRENAPKTLRLYVLDCGVLNVTTEGVERYHVTPAEVGETRMSGYRPSGITFVAVSHAHIDHTANLNLLAGATWLTRAAERDFMWADGNTRVRPAFYGSLRFSKTSVIDRDEYDVFGDGQVVIKAALGHTPGHQVLRLAKLALSCSAATSITTRRSGLLWIEHDFPANNRLKKAPAYYE